MNKNFRDELTSLLNRYSIENESDTPDFLLAEYLLGCLEVFNKASRDRDRYHGFKPFATETGWL